MGGGFDNSASQAIKDRINIVDLVKRYVNLHHSGGSRWMGPCPFHQETKGSFSVNEEEGFFYCFGCQASGDIFDFYSRINGVDFKEALEQLAEEAGIELKVARNPQQSGEADKARTLRKQALKMHEVAKKFYRGNLLATAGKACREYIAARELSKEIVESFELGWSLPEWSGLSNALRRAGFSPADTVASGLVIHGDKGAYDRFRSRLMFPIKNLSGHVIAFGGRIIDQADTAKYINSSDSPIYKKGDNLYGLFQARRAVSAKKSVMMTEGYMDVLTLHQFGYQNSCGVLGTALTAEQIKRLAGFTSHMELIFDGDPPGRKAALRSAEMILSRGLNCRVVLLPDDEDIDSLLKGHGKEEFEDLREKAPDGFTFCLRVLNESYAPKDALAWMKQFMQHLELPELAGKYVSEFARGLGFDAAILRKDLGLQEMHPRRYWAGQKRLPGDTAPGVAAPSFKKPDPDRQFLAFAIRNLHHVERLAECGLEFALSAPWARDFWSKIVSVAPSCLEGDILAQLDDKEKQFWIRQRSVVTLPPDEAKDELECAQICDSIRRVIETKQNASRSQVLSSLNGDDYENELLRALHEKLTGQPLVEK